MNYTDIIFTNHALEKITNRGISKNNAYETLVHPDQSFEGKKNGTVEFRKKFDGFKITAVAKQNERKEWIVISLWQDPPLPGTQDAKRQEQWKKNKKSSALSQIWKTVRVQLGL